MVVRRNVIPEPLLSVGGVPLVARIAFIGGLLRKFGTEDLVNCGSVLTRTSHHISP
jgi:hypothetical protein